MRHPTFALIAVAVAGACSAAPILDITHVKDLRLENGLHIVVKEEPYSNLVAAGFCIKASPLYETDQQHGLADIVREMLTRPGTDDKPSIAQRIIDLGGDFKSYTSPDATQISFSVATPAFRQLFPAFARAVMEPVFDEAAWAADLPRLRQELSDMRASPLGLMSSLLWETAYRKHPYGRLVQGSPDAIAAHNAQDLADFHKALYVPGNISLIVVGDIKAQEVFDLARQYLGNYLPTPADLPQVAAEAPQTDSRIRLETAPTRGTLVTYAWHAADIKSKRDVCALDLIYAVLGEGKDARLVKALEKCGEEGLAPNVEFITKRDPGLFIITTVSKPDLEFDAREAVLGEVDKLRTTPLTDAELTAAKDIILGGYAFDNQSYGEQVGAIAFYEAIDTYKFAFDYPDEVQRVTAEDIQRVARAYLASSTFNLVIIRPRTPSGAAKEACLPR